MADCSKTRILAILLGVLCLTFAEVIAVFINQELRHRDSKEKEINAENINSFFPGYFRSPEEQRLYESRYMSGFTNRTVVEPRISYFDTTCGFSCRSTFAKKLKKRQLAAVEHGCCRSNVAFIAPNKRSNVNGRERTILQFGTNKQYFAVHSCTALRFCRGCQCSQENGMYIGVAVKDGVKKVDDLDDVELDFFYFDGCCKCIND
ncbi:uncharacterized protein LOC128224451 isoform X1 [Mya arenaria]|uniref:uncharacterized protein LOC128224451 isoform X1 n=1 Tax=Mya arenaria TaxID=6604 RepID=UPI0022E1468D|nr:uncharacterized protein LOC128224451 isoform X1 [Mya arenaria]